MSTQATAEGQRLAEGLIPLLKEFTRKLRSKRKEAQEIKGQLAKQGGLFGGSVDEWLNLQNRLLQESFRELRPAATQLAQEVSQLVEHANLNEITKLELRLRFAEYQSALRAAEEFLRAEKS